MATVRSLDLKVTVGFEDWFNELAKDMATALNRAVESGMDVEEALACYQECVGRALKSAIIWRN